MASMAREGTFLAPVGPATLDNRVSRPRSAGLVLFQTCGFARNHSHPGDARSIHSGAQSILNAAIQQIPHA